MHMSCTRGARWVGTGTGRGIPACELPLHAWQVIKVRGAGMPLRDADPPRNGTLHVRALVEFPASLSPEAQRLAELLPDGS